MGIPLDDRTRAIIKACVPALEAHGANITRNMYQRLLAAPDIRGLFNMSHQKDGEQPKALALAVLAYARHIDDLGSLGGMVERIADKHVALNILPEHYPFVATALLGAIEEVLGDAATPEIMEAWGRAYWFLADILITREHQIYDADEAAPGGWVGWRDFVVRARHAESEIITSFILAPVDGRPVMRHLPGQYLTFRLDIPGHGSQRRNYSISSAPDDRTYRITVRRMEGGVVSEWLHNSARLGDVLSVSAPAGDFVLADPVPPSVVLLSAGVGLTPLVSMLATLVDSVPSTRVHFVHGTQSSETQAFSAYIRDLAASGHLQADVFYSDVVPDNRVPAIRAHHGRITKDWLAEHADPDATYYLCGPDGFTRDAVDALTRAGLPRQQIRHEFFGSTTDEAFVI